MGVESIRDIPDDFDLTDIQRRAATCVQTGEPWFSAELGEVLRGLKYPLYFMDFETVNWAIPRFPGMRPYDQLPFQFSVHSQKEPGATLEHHEFLATDASDPRREFITPLCAALGKSGSIVVYSSFESQRLSELAEWLPDYAEADHLDPSPPVRFAACRAGTHLSPGIRRLVLHQVGVASAGAGDDLRGDGGFERAGCRTCMGVASSWRFEL